MENNSNYNNNRGSDYTQNQGNKTDDKQKDFKDFDDFKSYVDSNYKKSWISDAADPDMVTFADKAGKFTAKKELSNSKIRNIYGEVMRIKSAGFEKNRPDFYLLKPKLAYALGREKNNQGLEAFKKIFDLAWDDVKDEKSFLNFCNLMEAILAYHKAHGGK